MAGRRPLTPDEEIKLLRVVRALAPRDRALVTTQWMTGFRISEVLSLTVGSVVRGGELAGKIGVAPRHLKGGYGRTRWIPVLPELAKALEKHPGCLRRRFELVPAMPLFLSRECALGEEMRALSRESARRIIRGAFAQAKLLDDGRLGTHTLRKTWARKVYENSGNDLMFFKAALGHSDISITQKYFEVSEDAVAAAIARCDLAKIRPRPAKIVEIAKIAGTRPAVAG